MADATATADTSGHLASYSYIELLLNFSENEALRDSMMRFDKTIRYGLLLEVLDALAADVAHR